MDYTSDSDISKDTKDLVSQGLASDKGKRVTTPSQIGRLRERATVPKMDTSSVRYGDTLCGERPQSVIPRSMALSQ